MTKVQKTNRSALPVDDLPRVTSGTGFGFLSGVRVVDLTTSVAGPYATMLLAEFGAEVIKVERSSGDDARHWGPPFLDGQALWFTAVNRNKKSVVLDLKSDDGRNDLEKLVASADVFVTNQPLDVQRKLGLDYESVKAMRDDIVFVSITGFGLNGARSGMTCYDLIAEGYSGIMDITGTADAPPQKIGAPAADMLAGQDAAMATLAVLCDRMRTGKGRLIDISLVESMTRFLSCRISSYLGSGEIPERSGGTDSVIAIYQAFETADLPITLGLGSDAIWRRFWETVGDVEFGQREEFASNAARRDHRAEIVAHIQSFLKAARRETWLERFARARIPAGPINRVDEVANDADLQERGMFYALEGENGAVQPQIGLGIQVDGAYSVARSLPPRLGEHTDAIMRELHGQEKPAVTEID
ncbi:CoA transferase [Roseovarius sp. PS-C2]|uniref:CaiB/BaiF CoA transferase family protein n=1 Tax=Roseovarius sp. PS-C2 TaxID=2820814 RepID=UPI001C0B73B1|nr:CoA transferase [Roseovarius sp. PS-C2]MBU3261503.1 CoA transferase [Roseovarius sp. PS-C2]